VGNGSVPSVLIRLKLFVISLPVWCFLFPLLTSLFTDSFLQFLYGSLLPLHGKVKVKVKLKLSLCF